MRSSRPASLLALAALVGLAACTGASPLPTGADRDPSQDDAVASVQASDAAQDSAGPSSTAAAAGPPAADDWFVVVADGVRVRGGPSTSGVERGVLPSGTDGLVVDGPVEADGHEWFFVAGRFNPNIEECSGPASTTTGHIDLGCNTWYGWVAGGEAGEAWIERSEPECPASPTTVDEISRLEYSLAMYCFGGDTITFDAYLSPESPGRGCGVTPYEIEPEWLFHCWIVFLQHEETPVQGQGPEIAANVHPTVGSCTFGGGGPADTCPFAALSGQWVTVQATWDHPEAASCQAVNPTAEAPEPELVIYECRNSLVITSVAPRD